MFSSFSRPQAKTIVVFSYYNYSLKTAGFSRTDNLHGIKMRWIKQRRVFITITPFLIGIGIRSVMNKAIHLSFLPIELSLSGQRSVRFRRGLSKQKCGNSAKAKKQA